MFLESLRHLQASSATEYYNTFSVARYLVNAVSCDSAFNCFVRKTIDVLGRELLNKLEQAGVGSRPIIWIGHSMGGTMYKTVFNVLYNVM